MASTSALHIGVLLAVQVQLLDMSAIDLFAMASPEYLRIARFPPHLASLGKPVDIHYIGKSDDEELQDLTAQIRIKTNSSIKDKKVAPNALDILMIPGPDPNKDVPEDVREFVRAHHAAGTTILVICTGAFIAGYSGIVKGRTVTGPRALIPELKRKFPEAKKWDDSLRVVRDGNLWSCG